MTPQNLNSVRDILHRMGGTATIKGQDRSAFVYATHQNRAVEISLTHDGSWWIEFWSDDENPDAGPVHAQIVMSPDEATAAAAHWLFGATP